MSDLLCVGDSVACAGVCLTATKVLDGSFSCYVSPETYRLTNLSVLKVGDKINLEPSLKVGDRLDGHFVQGHVDCTACILDVTQDADSWVFRFELPTSVSRYVAGKGSICLDGVSLTVNGVDDKSFWVNIIPYTFKNTTFCQKKPGDYVNLEVDMMARYIDRLLSSR